MGNTLFDNTISTLVSSMDVRAARHRLLASNVANAETPGYRAVDLDFAKELKKASGGEFTASLTSTSPRHFGGPTPGGPVNPEVIYTPSAEGGLDNNTVGIETEMVKLSENSMMYTMATKLLKYKFGTLMTAIKEGGR